MTSFDDVKTMVRRNKLFGMWAAEKLGLTGAAADNYSDALATGTIDADGGDVFKIVRKDFDAAGVVQSDEQILNMMNTLMLEAGQMQPTGGSGSDAAGVMLVRKLTTR
jgi:hypothetical protein